MKFFFNSIHIHAAHARIGASSAGTRRTVGLFGRGGVRGKRGKLLTQMLLAA
jgi:hypothetical protein